MGKTHFPSSPVPSRKEHITNDQRDAKGRFTKGNTGGPGNPFGRRVAELRKAMLAAVSLQDITEVFQALLTKAKTGDTQAMKLFLAYTVGKPDKVPDPDRVDVEEWEVHKETAAMTETMATVMKAPTPDLALQMAGCLRPAMSRMYAQTITDMIDKAVKPAPMDAPPSATDFSAESAEPLPAGSYTEVPPGMYEFYQKLVERGFAPPIPSGAERV